MVLGKLDVNMSVANGLYLLFACTPIGIVGWLSAIAQGKLLQQVYQYLQE